MFCTSYLDLGAAIIVFLPGKRRRPRKDPKDMTEEEKVMEQLAALPITGPGIPKREYYDDEYEDEDVEEQPQSPDVQEKVEPSEEPTVTPVLNEPVLTGTHVKEEL